MAASKTQKGSRQDLFANSVVSAMSVNKKEESAPSKKPEIAVDNKKEKTTPVKQAKKSVGRPKGVEKTQISLYLPNELLRDMECATYQFKGNATAYITSLIEKDMKDNKEKYDTIRSIIKS